MKQGIKAHYHWLIVVLVLLEMIVFGGVINSFSVFMIPLCEDLGATRGEFALATMPYTVVTFISTIFSGYLLKHWGYKRAAIASLLLAASGMALMSFANSMAVFCISRILFAMGYGVCFTAGAVQITREWFWKHQGLAIGIVTMGTGVGGSLMTVLITTVMERTNWRVASMVVAASLMAIALSYLLLRNRPEDMGLQPFGFGQLTQPKKISRADRAWEGYPLNVQMRQPAFYLMIFCLLVCCGCIYITSMVVVPHFRDLGYSPEAAAAYQSVFMLTVAVAKLGAGGLSDRFGAKVVTVGCVVCAILGQGMLGLTGNSALCYVAVILFAVGLCMSSSVVPLLAADLFGYKGSTQSNGVFLAMTAIANIVSTPLTNFSYDQQGSYMPIFRAAAAVNSGILVLFFLLFVLANREKQRFLIQQ